MPRHRANPVADPTFGLDAAGSAPVVVPDPHRRQAKSFLTATEIGSYEEDGEVYDREKLGRRSDDSVFMKHEVPKNFEFDKPFLTSVELFKRYFPVMRLHNWYMVANSLGVINITFQILENAFYSGARLGSIEWEDL
jgi:hypothetical protein